MGDCYEQDDDHFKRVRRCIADGLASRSRRRAAQSQYKRERADLLFKKPDLNLQKPNSPVVNGSTNAVKTGRAATLTGVGVPGGLNTGTGFKTPNGSSVMPKGAADTVKNGVSGLKLGAGQAKGVEAKDGISERLAPGMNQGDQG